MHRNAGQERLASGASMFEGTVTLAAGHGGRTRAGGWPRGRDPRPRGASFPAGGTCASAEVRLWAQPTALAARGDRKSVV